MKKYINSDSNISTTDSQHLYKIFMSGVSSDIWGELNEIFETYELSREAKQSISSIINEASKSIYDICEEENAFRYNPIDRN